MLHTPHPLKVVLKPFLVFSLWSAIASMVPGCSVGDFVGAYFNTYYNARRQFVEAEDELFSKENKSADRAFGYTFMVQPSTKTKLVAVIEKCSKLLQYHPQSTLVDDALIMIGKSYYYQNEYQQAERKFTELIEQFPASDLVSEARLTLAYCYYMENDKSKASLTANSLLDDGTKSNDDDYVSKASALLARIEADNKNISQAKALYQTVAEKAGTSRERCAAYLNLAELLSQEGNSQRALEVYRKATGESASYETEYKSRIGEARMLSRLGAYEESLSVLRELLSSSNFREFYAEISLEIANVFKESKEYGSAIGQYTYVDTTYARTETAANSYFQLGDLYEVKTVQWDSANVYYTKGKTEYSQAPITAQLIRRSDYLTRYIQHRNAIQRYDSIRAYILTPRDTTPVNTIASIDSSGDSLHARHDSTGAKAPVPSSFTLDSVNVLLAREKVEMASLLYTTMELPDSATRWYHRLLDEHPSSVHVPRSLFSLAQIYSQDTSLSRSIADSLYRVIIRRFPDSEFKPESERLLGLPVQKKIADPAEGAYVNAEVLLNAGNTKGAGDALRGIVETYPSSPIASKAQYAIGWIYERLQVQPDSAISSYKKLVALYPTSKYVGIVKPMIDEYDLSKKPALQPKDSTSLGQKDSLLLKPDLHPLKDIPLDQKKGGDSLEVKDKQKE